MKRLGQILMTPWFFRRLALVWACWLSTIIVFKTFGVLTQIDGVKAGLIGTFFGVLVTIVGFYHKDRNADKGIQDPEPLVPVVQSNEPEEIV